ncbi:hypothetical protein [Deinococcus multiflagellatus]|uniref:Uncharacterized protein n=1 Tax=Deinococcus multiflagellatus TaxID=1656887 RepID=A0ABW1ZR23_9DEIO|nr:hypothetical protein [Deinococcus multiflagellatus]MBZ9715316.1 hypothetical protein [Deinococcus multiflagellatus]
MTLAALTDLQVVTLLCQTYPEQFMLLGLSHLWPGPPSAPQVKHALAHGSNLIVCSPAGHWRSAELDWQADHLVPTPDEFGQGLGAVQRLLDGQDPVLLMGWTPAEPPDNAFWAVLEFHHQEVVHLSRARSRCLSVAVLRAAAAATQAGHLRRRDA